MNPESNHKLKLVEELSEEIAMVKDHLAKRLSLFLRK
jgi:hypothetical protein